MNKCRYKVVSFLVLCLASTSVLDPVFANSAQKQAAPIKRQKTIVQLKGAAAFNAYAGSQKNKNNIQYYPDDRGQVVQPREVSARNQSTMFGFDDTRLEFEVSQPFDYLSFLKWKLNIAFSADKSAVTPSFVKQAYITLISKYATMEFGNYSGVEDRMAFSAVSILDGTGGFDGNAQKFAATTTGTHANVDLVGKSAEATKITLFSPSWKGIKVGVSYTPSTSHLGGANLKTDGSTNYARGGHGNPYSVNNIAVGLSYVGFLTPSLKLSTSLTGVMAKSKAEIHDRREELKRRNIRSWALGTILSYKNFSLAGEYADCGKSGQFSNDALGVNPLGISGNLNPLNYNAATATAPKFFDVAFSYIYNQTKFAVGYLQSHRKTGFSNIKATAKVWNASITQQVATGLKVYLEGFRYDTKNDAVDYEAKLLTSNLRKTTAAVGNQKANVIILGMKASF
jgi:hypothetical protein